MVKCILHFRTSFGSSSVIPGIKSLKSTSQPELPLRSVDVREFRVDQIAAMQAALQPEQDRDLHIWTGLRDGAKSSRSLGTGRVAAKWPNRSLKGSNLMARLGYSASDTSRNGGSELEGPVSLTSGNGPTETCATTQTGNLRGVVGRVCLRFPGYGGLDGRIAI
jgi:hypothetical protein